MYLGNFIKEKNTNNFIKHINPLMELTIKNQSHTIYVCFISYMNK